jgi:sugar phosphate isomerase/epimerase
MTTWASRFSVCQNTLTAEAMPLDLDLVVAAQAVAVAPLSRVVAKEGAVETRRLLDERGLAVSSLIPGLGVLDGTREQAEEALLNGLRIAETLGAPLLLVTTGPRGTLPASEADAEVVSRLRAVASLAQDRGITLGLEPVHPLLTNFSYVHTLDHAADIVGAVPGAGIVFDTFHLYWERCLESLIAAFVGSIATVQLANLSPTGLGERRWLRGALDDGPIDVGAIVRCFESAGFRGYYEYEVLGYAGVEACLAGARAAYDWFARQAPAGATEVAT